MKKILIPAIVVVVLLVSLMVAYPYIMKSVGGANATPETTVLSDEAPSTDTLTTIKVNGVVYDVHTNGAASLMDWFNEHGKRNGYTIKGEKIYAPDGEHCLDTKGLALNDKFLQPDDEFTLMAETQEGYVPHVTPADGVSDTPEQGSEETTSGLSEATGEELGITEEPVSGIQEESTENKTEEIIEEPVTDPEEVVESESLAPIGTAD